MRSYEKWQYIDDQQQQKKYFYWYDESQISLYDYTHIEIYHAFMNGWCW